MPSNKETSESENTISHDIIDCMEEAVVAYDANGCLLACNRAFREMYNYTPDQARPGVHYRELGEIDIQQGNVVVEDEKGTDYLERKAAYRTNLEGSFIVKLKDGRWIRTNDRRAPNGGFVSVHIDITELKNAQDTLYNAELRRREEADKLHRFYLDNMEVGAFLIENATIVDVSSLGADMFGYHPSELIGQPPTFVVSERSKENVYHRVKSRNEEAYESEGQKKDGSTFPMLVKGRELVYEGRNVRLTTIVDLSERKQTEVELRKLSRAVEQSPNSIFITDTDGNIEFVNAKFTQTTGYTPEEVIGQTPRILASGETPRGTYERLWETIKSGNVWRNEMKDRRKDGSVFWANITIAPVKDDEGVVTHFISTHEDISRRKEAETSAQIALEKAEIANRAKSELMANMSHELRTPLNAIIGFSQTIKDEVLGPIGNDKYREYLEDIHHSGQHLLELINDILDVSAIEAGALNLNEEEAFISDIITWSMSMIRPRAERANVKITTILDPENSLLRIDVRRVKQVMLNLLSNAVKFTPSGGQVTVGTQHHDDGALSCWVCDNGIGMSQDEMLTALTQFGQVDSGLDRTYEGTGLGLPLTKGLMKLHGGSLDIESLEGYGTLVTVTFPKERVMNGVC